ncbi:MAG TPA: hypothetical protein VG917_00210 [Patescibacteria group bacterium]|nr:hypothetical protein [Patescibacteria group bacterium]
MKTIFTVALLALVLISPKIAYAHEFETDGSIQAVLHVDPDDTPIAGSQSNISIEVKDSTNKFDPQKCDCNVYIYQGDKNIMIQPLSFKNEGGNLYSSSFNYIFPEYGGYHVKLSGEPINQSFNSFSIVFDQVDVEKPNYKSVQAPQQDNTAKRNRDALALMPGVIGVGLLGYVIYEVVKKKLRKKAPKVNKL